jgi:hypothetical protein
MADAQSVLVRVFAPLHKRALGLAVGLTFGAIIFLMTAFHLIIGPVDDAPIALLAQYFYGYDVSWRGAVLGLWWGFVAGFAAGWFFAFCRNFVVATWVFVIRTRASLYQASDFPDHI